MLSLPFTWLWQLRLVDQDISGHISVIFRHQSELKENCISILFLAYQAGPTNLKQVLKVRTA